MAKQIRWGFLGVALLLLAQAGAMAQPVIGANGVRNGASYAYPGQPNSGVAQGSIFVVFGQHLGPEKIVQVSSYPLPTSEGLAGTSIKVIVGQTSVDAIMLYTLATQVAAVLPSNTPVGNGSVTVTYNGQTSAPAPITVVQNSVGIFALNQAGTGRGVLQNVNSSTDRPVNSQTEAANPGQVMILWGTGLGPVSGNEASGALPGNMADLNLHVFVGNKEAAVQYQGRSGCCTGIDQIVFAVPAGVEGCSIPVYVQDNGVISNFVTMAIAASRTTCSDPNGLTASQVLLAKQNGGLRVGNLSVGRSINETPKETNRADQLGGYFTKVSLTALQNSAAAPRAGSCLVIQTPGGNPPGQSPGLDAGGVSAATPAGSYTLPATPGYKGSYGLLFSPATSGSIPGIVNNGTLLSAGQYTFTVSGGADVGAATASIQFPLSFSWTNDTQIKTVDRSKPLTITWSGGTPGALVLIEVQSEASYTVSGTLLCYEDATLGTYTIPSSLLSALPASFVLSGNPQGAVSVSETYVGGEFSASGLDYGSISFSDTVNKGAVAIQ